MLSVGGLELSADTNALRGRSSSYSVRAGLDSDGGGRAEEVARDD